MGWVWLVSSSGGGCGLLVGSGGVGCGWLVTIQVGWVRLGSIVRRWVGLQSRKGLFYTLNKCSKTCS